MSWWSFGLLCMVGGFLGSVLEQAFGPWVIVGYVVALAITIAVVKIKGIEID
jgi:hypothetical protein